MFSDIWIFFTDLSAFVSTRLREDQVGRTKKENKCKQEETSGREQFVCQRASADRAGFCNSILDICLDDFDRFVSVCWRCEQKKSRRSSASKSQRITVGVNDMFTCERVPAERSSATFEGIRRQVCNAVSFRARVNELC
jgi:hypothetical protein